MNDSHERADIAYTIRQSNVESIIRFKFGAWLEKNMPESLTLNLVEAGRLDLTVGINDDVYFIEFGHLSSLLKHAEAHQVSKVAADTEKILEKVAGVKNKIAKFDSNFFIKKKEYFLTCSLFSHFGGALRQKKYAVQSRYSPLRAGALFKYGLYPAGEEYFNALEDDLVRRQFIRQPYQDGELSLWWKMEEYLIKPSTN
jgi:hypothetical protein